MDKKFFFITVAEDNFIGTITNDSGIEVKTDADGIEYVEDIKSKFITISNVALLRPTPDGKNISFLPFEKMTGTRYITLNTGLITQIYVPKEEVVQQVRSVLSGIQLA
jgi:hypothetical protein